MPENPVIYVMVVKNSNLWKGLENGFLCELYYLQKAVSPYAISYSSALGNFYEGALSVPDWPEELSSKVVLCAAGVKCQGSFAMKLLLLFCDELSVDSHLLDNFVAIIVDDVTDEIVSSRYFIIVWRFD